MINNPATAAAQVESVLNTMLYESKPVYIGVAPEVLGVVIALPAAGTAGSSSGAGQGRYVMTAGQVNAASAGEFCIFLLFEIRCWGVRWVLTCSFVVAVAMAFIR